MAIILDILTRIINFGHRSIQPLNSIRFSLNYNWLGPTMAVPFTWTFDFNFELRMSLITFMLILVATSPTDIM